MSTSPYPYTCELCGAEGLTDDGMRAHTVQAHLAGKPECPFCDAAVPQPQILGHVHRTHLHYLTPERELMAFIDDQSPSFEDDSKMTNTDSCSFYTPGSANGWHSPDVTSSPFGAISKNNINYHNGDAKDRDRKEKSYKDKHRNEKDEAKCSRSPKNINLTNGIKNINISNGVIPKKKLRSRESSCEDVIEKERKNGRTSNSPSHNNHGSYEGSPAKTKTGMGSGGQGSPLRSQLALKLKPNTPKKAPARSPTVQCLLCEFTSTCPKKLEEHINRAHFDLTSPSLMANPNANSNSNPTLGLENPTLALTNAMAATPEPGTSTFQCPLCEKQFATGSDVEVHVNVDHRDILSPQRADQVDNASCNDVVMMEESPVSNCPVCCQPLPLSQHELMLHIEDHFEHGEENGAVGMTKEEKEAQRNREEREFQLLKEQYGMSSEDATWDGVEEVRRGALTAAEHCEKIVAARRGLEPVFSRTEGIIERIYQLSAECGVARTYLCSAVHHYATALHDRGWGCGYRNMQMLLSSLAQCPEYAGALGSVCVPRGAAVPSIPALQLLVEKAWKMGFDTQGSEQLGWKLHNTRKWIGACEVVTVLSSLRIRCSLIDFHKPTAADGGHPALFDWVLRYFQQTDRFIPPLYLQHQGHSRTIIGYEKHRDGKSTLLVLDPSHSPAQVRQLFSLSGSAAYSGVRRAGGVLRARQYQLCAVTGLILTDQQYEASKVLQSIRIP